MLKRLDRCLIPINERRVKLLDDIESAPGTDAPSVEEVVHAFLAPALHRLWGERGRTVLQLIGRIHRSETNEDHLTAYIQLFDEVIRRFSAALQRALPHLDAVDINWRMLFLLGSMAFAMGEGGALVTRDPQSARDLEDVLESLIQFTAAGMASPIRVRLPVSTAR